MKMNGKFKAGFILLLFSLACAVVVGVVGFLLKKASIAQAVGAVGAVCAFIGILLAMRSGKKPEEPPAFEEELPEYEEEPPAFDEND